MTISNTLGKAGPFSGNGVTTAFPFTFHVFANTDIQVVKTSSAGVESTLVLNSDYSVALNADQDASPGGTVTYPISGTPLAVGEKLTLVSIVQSLQGTTITNGGGFFPAILTTMADRLTVICNQIIDKLSRTLRAPVSDSTTIGELPTATDRASKVLGFNASGDPIAVSNVPTSGVSASAYIQTLLDDADAATARKTLGAAGTVGAGRNIAARTNSVSPNSKIDITADRLIVEDTSGMLMVLSTVSVTLDITASGANGLDTGVEAVSTWYYGWVIAKADGTVAGLLSTSATAPTMPSGYTYKALVSAVRNNSGSNFNAYRQFGNRVHYEGVQNALTSTTINTVETTLSVASQVPAIATAIDLHVNGDVQGSGGVFSASLRLRYISGSNFCSVDAQSSNGGTGSINTSREFPNVSQQVFYNWSNVTNLNTQFVLIDVLGFRLPIGGQ